MPEPTIERRSASIEAVEIAKLEGRMDQGFTAVNGRLDTMIAEARAEREARQAANQELRKDVDDHEKRIRSVEERKTVAPWQLWLVTSGALGLIIAGFAALKP